MTHDMDEELQMSHRPTSRRVLRVTTVAALLPVALQLHQPGHEIEGPMAVVILGGLVSSTLVSLLLIPPLAVRWLRGSEMTAQTLPTRRASALG